MVKAVFVDLFPTMFDVHGVYSLAAVCAQRGIAVDYICENQQEPAIEKCIASGADYILYSSFSATADTYESFDHALKERMKVTSVIGGPGPTFDSHDGKKSSIDAYCIGEGEIALPAFILNGETGRNIRLSGDTSAFCYYPFADLDSLPFPDRNIVYRYDRMRREKSVKHFLSGKGCPYNCTYCFNHAYRSLFKGAGKVLRQKSVDYFIEEIARVQQEYGFSSVSFSDDTFILDKKWLHEFCRKFSATIGTQFTCGVRANLMDDDTARILSESGCSVVNWSIETGNESLRNNVLKRNMSDSQILYAAEVLHKYKIPFVTGNVIASPGETLKQMDETVRLNIQVNPDLALAKIFAPYPGLKLTEYAIEKGCLTPDVRLEKDELFFRTPMNYSSGDKKRISKLMSLFPFFVSFPCLFKNRLLKAFAYLLPVLPLRIAYEVYSGYRTMRLYVVKTSLLQRFRMIYRYLVNLRLG